MATNLIQKIIETSKELGYAIIRLNASEIAKPLYVKFGFRDTENDMVLKINLTLRQVSHAFAVLKFRWGKRIPT